MRGRCLVPVVLCIILVTSGYGQVINATLSGTVSDPSGALIPGVEVTVKQTDTGVVSSTVTNESGTYRFGSLQPGPYQVNAALSGFQAQTFQVTLGTAQQIRQNFVLQVGGVAQAVEVSTAADPLLTGQSASVGNALQQKQVVDLPLVDRNVMDFATKILPGVRIGSSGLTNAADTTFGGITATGSGNIGLQLDGVTVNTGRHAQGLVTQTFINPDMVDEVRVVVAAVDPEGRGSAQVQMRSRSGTNNFHGALTSNIRNSVLDANSWSNNFQGIAPVWYNKAQYTATLGGPIVRNKTFFFGVIDGQEASRRAVVSSTVLTDTARQGIFRFFPGVNNGAAQTTASGSGTSAIAPVVDLQGNPLDFTQIPGATGPIKSFSVFGDALNPGDPNRTAFDPTGFMTKLFTYMPHANAFNAGSNCTASVPCDGLNTATARWVLHTVGDSAGFTGNNSDELRRRQLSIKIDHQFNAKNRLSATATRQNNYSDNNLVKAWPAGWNGAVTEYPKVVSAQLTSTLTPSLLNEFHWGYRNTTLNYIPAFHVTQDAWDFLTKVNGIPIIQSPVLFPSNVLAAGSAYSGNASPLFTYTDTLGWTKGSHAFKTGLEFRYGSSKGWAAGLMPTVTGGAGAVPVKGIDTISGLLPSNQTLAQNMLLSMSGSVQSVSETFQTQEPTDTTYGDFRTEYFLRSNPAGRYGPMREWHQNEVNFFVKDDWKVTPSLTLNFGMRYDLFRVPYQVSASGANWTQGLLGGSQTVFGYSGRSIDNWMSGGSAQMGDLTQIVEIGRGTSYPKQGIWPSDKNNFAPAVGFAWSPKWGGKDKTTVRGGYQIAYQLPGNTISWISVDTGSQLSYSPTDSGNGTFRNYTNLTIPLPVTQRPFVGVIPLTNRSTSLSLFAPDYTTPYVQTMTLGVTRSLASNVTLDVRYVGTHGMKLHSTMNLNDAEIRRNGLLNALAVTRAGGNAPMFDQMLQGLNLGNGVVGQTVTGSQALRQNATFRSLIANGDFVGVARLLNTTNVGTVQPAGQIIAGGTLRSSGLFPENFIVTNPQFSSITYRNNSDSSHYHSLQTQLTLRPKHGISFQSTYTWSRSLAVGGGSDSSGTFSGTYRDLQNRNADYTLQPSHRKHDFRMFGTFDLPVGPGKTLDANSSPWLARIVEGWRVGSILNVTSGAPLNASGGNTLYALGNPNIVGSFPRQGKVRWPSNQLYGNFFGQQYQRVPDPACASVSSDIKAFCTNTALADANGNIVLQNAAPGQLGTLGLNPFEGPGFWSLDGNLQKSIRIAESKRLTFRVDATNLFNHPTPANPNLNINSGTFGQITSKTGNRMLAAQIHADF
jgi:hypothetical protein